MNNGPLKTLKEVTAHLRRPAHRVIHVCEAGLVRPAVAAAGRGSVRRFSREDVFRLVLALELQEAGVRAPRIRPLMQALDRLLELRAARPSPEFLGALGDLLDVLGRLGSGKFPVRAYLTPPDRVALVAPRLPAAPRPGLGVDLHRSDGHLLDAGVCLVVNLTRLADHLRHSLFAAGAGAPAPPPPGEAAPPRE
jgi:hypothetical protein